MSWTGLFGVQAVFSAAPNAELAALLEQRGARATAVEVREEIALDGDRDEVEVSFTTAAGDDVSAHLTGYRGYVEEGIGRPGLGTLWRPATDEYAAPPEIVYDPRDPQQVMAASDVPDHADGTVLRGGMYTIAPGAGAVLLGVVISLVAVAVRLLRRRR